MGITREPDYPVEYAQLANALSSCADGHSADAVLNASIQMVTMAIVHICKARGCSKQDVEGYTEHICEIITKEVKGNWDRKKQPTDVAVRTA